MGIAYQFWSMISVLVFAGLFVAATIGLVWVPLQRQIAADPSPVVQSLLSALLFRIELWLAPLLFLSGALAAIVALFRARRIAASMTVLYETLAKLAIADAEPLSFPRGDEFQRFEAPVAGVARRIEQLTRGNIEMLRVLRHNLDGLEQRAGANAEFRESVRVLIRDVDTEIKKLQMKS